MLLLYTSSTVNNLIQNTFKHSCSSDMRSKTSQRSSEHPLEADMTNRGGSCKRKGYSPGTNYYKFPQLLWLSSIFPSSCFDVSFHPVSPPSYLRAWLVLLLLLVLVSHSFVADVGHIFRCGRISTEKGKKQRNRVNGIFRNKKNVINFSQLHVFLSKISHLLKCQSWFVCSSH